MIDFDAWTVDTAQGIARHDCGAVIEVEGDPANPTAVDPRDFPKSLDFLEQARLLRSGMEALAAAGRSRPGRDQKAGKSAVVENLEQQAKMFAERPDKPQRAVLSRKKTPA